MAYRISTLALLLPLLLATGAHADRRSATVGGRSGMSWSGLALKWVALDDTTAVGSVQPKELMAWENVIAGPGPLENVYGFQWHRGKSGMEAMSKEMGLHPRIWNATDSETVNEVFDGDPATFKPLALIVPPDEYNEYTTATSSGSETGVFNLQNEVYTLDLGIEMPLERIRFYPPQFGVDKRGVPYRNTAPQGFEVSVARYPQDYLLLGTEAYPWHALDLVVERALANSSSIVDIEFDLQFLRFIRINLSLMRQAYSLAEIEAYGRGAPPRALLLSEAVDFGEPVNYGEVRFVGRTFRRGDDGELREDPSAPARLVLQTKTGSDDTPLSHHVIDELGRDVEATQRQYQMADPPRIDRTGLRLPGMRGAITEDEVQWTPWSSPYGTSGDQNRSADGRRYLEFQLVLETDDPMAFVRVDSIDFEYSPLLVRRVVGEVSLESDPSQQVVEIEAGVEHVFAYDIRASFDVESQQGFDGVRLDVPEGSRLLGLAVGSPPTSIEPDSVRAGDGELAVYFPSHRVMAADNRPVRVRLAAPLLNSSLLFTGDVLDTQSDNLPQSIDAGDANGDVSSNSLQVFATQARLSVLSSVEVVPRAVTPNGDDVNDETSVHFTIMGVERCRVDVAICDLAGRRVALVASGARGPGLHREHWDGRDLQGSPLSPGLYLCRVSVDTESGTEETVRVIAVAY